MASFNLVHEKHQLIKSEARAIEWITLRMIISSEEPDTIVTPPFQWFGSDSKVSAGSAFDVSEEIVWRVDSKIAAVCRTNGSTKKNLRFDYDAMGNRIAKHIYADNAFTQWENSTYYVRDASGNVMATYEREATGQTPPSSFRVAERHLYGSSRLGIDATPYEFIATNYNSSQEASRSLGQKHYEISNHLGNVLSVITDQKLPVVDASTVVSYAAVVLSATDYSPFGVGLYGRSWSEGYRFGFNGMEKLSGAGNAYDFGSRIYDPRLGKFYSLDPVSPTMRSPYSYAANNPIAFIDIEGEWPCWSCWAKKALPFVSIVLDFVPIVGQVKGLVEAAVGYSMDGSKLEPWERALALLPGGKIAKAVAVVGTAVIAITKTKKIVEKVKKVAKKVHIRLSGSHADNVTDLADDLVNGNNKLSKKPQHFYEIKDADTGETYKYGISGGKLNKNGTSKRANRQVNKLNRQGGNFEAEVLHKDIPGRQNALDIEEDYVTKYAADNGGQAPLGNLRPKPRKPKRKTTYASF